ncbi:MAG: glycosyltransferase family 4 protein [Lachnospiraceae bacterium]|nr:glycosyltransferase family 4 protein [Lachnospiraceae bacterium]
MEEKYRVLIVHNYYQIPGGEDTVVANERKLLEDHGHEVSFYSRSNVELKTMSAGRKLLLPLTTVFNPKTYRDVKRLIREKEIDIVHVHNTLNLISPSVYYAAFSCGVPVVQTVHNFRLLCPDATFYRDGHICEDCVEHGLGCALRHSCYRGSRLQTLACVVSTKIHRMLGTYGKIHYICLTEFNRGKLLQLKQIRPERVYVKPNFVETDGEVSPYESRSNQFIYVGRLDKLKGIETLFRAWQILGYDAPKLLVCGSGPLEDWCRDFLGENPDCNIRMLGFVSNTEVKGLIADSRALLLPTQWYEGFPMTVLEAYSAGTPVIGSNIGNVGDLIEEGVTGYKFPFDSAESLAAIVESIKKKTSISSGKIRDVFNERYSEQQNIQALEGIYRKAMQED